ncbi:hypothetical protein MMC31_003236 [Peltigera leucophlebia]|nr:hypothetical protein [Peltigera leucophlebia]
MAKVYALRLQYAQMIQAMKRVLKACLDKLVIGILYDEGWNPMILNNRLCFSFQAIPDMELRNRATNSWKGYRNKFYAEYLQKWALQGRESPEVESILMSLRQEFKGPKWDMKVNNLISLSTEKRFGLMAEGKLEEAEALNNAVRKTVARITDYGLGAGNVGFESNSTAQIPQPKESKTEGQIGEEVFAYAKKPTPRKDNGLGDGNVGLESTSITQVPQQKENKAEGQIGEEVFAYTKKSKPRKDYGPADGGVGFEPIQITRVPQPKESKTKGQIGEEVFAYAKKSTPSTDYGLGDRNVESESTPITQVPQPMKSQTEGRMGDEISVYAKTWDTGYGFGDVNVGFESTSITQVPQPKESVIQGQIGEEVFAYTRKTTPRKRTNKAFDEATPNPARKARRTQSNLPPKLNHYGTGNESSGDFDPRVVFVYTRKQPAAPRTKREPATIIPSITSSQSAAVMAEPAKETTEPLETAAQMAI